MRNYKMERLFFASSADQKYAGGWFSEFDYVVVLVCHIQLFVCSHALRCKSVFHNGMTCQFYQISRTDDNHSLRVGTHFKNFVQYSRFADNVGAGLARREARG